jgi:hypothetical protein
MRDNDGGDEPNRGILKAYIEIPVQLIYASKNVLKK